MSGGLDSLEVLFQPLEEERLSRRLSFSGGFRRGGLGVVGLWRGCDGVTVVGTGLWNEKGRGRRWWENGTPLGARMVW